jgi:predicted MPP superfamily phosphohydrolase
MSDNQFSKLAWLTDIHLNFLDEDERAVFYESIEKTNCDSVLITGDIAEAPSIEMIMKEMVTQINRPIYFVIGNHDYYRGSVKKVRDTLTSLTKNNDLLYWLPASGFQKINEKVIILGQDGWADGRLGDYQNSNVRLNDSRMIEELRNANILGRSQLLEKMQELADADAASLQIDLTNGLSQAPQKIIVLTHVPPFREACKYEGKISDNNWLPYFSSKVMGDLLIEIAASNPEVDFLVLCGHTHGEAHYQPLINLTVKAGLAEYSKPGIQEVIIM